MVVPALVDAFSVGSEARRALGGDEIAAPELFDLEVLSALRGLERRGLVGESDASKARARLARTRIIRCSHGPILRRAWELRNNLSIYDASYVALAESLGATLVTKDHKLTRAPGIRCEIELVA